MKNYLQHIDSLRGIAIIIVFLSHIDSTIFKSGAVNIFFVITGFLLSKIFISNNKFSFIDIVEFWIKRLSRLIPNILFICSITFILFACFTFFDNFQILLRSFLYSSIGLLNLYLLKIGNNYYYQDFDNPFIHLWAFGVIIQFIIIFPLLLYLAYNIKNFLRVNNFLRFLNLFFISLFILSFFTSLYFSNSLIGSFYSPLSRLWEFVIGIILYLNYENNPKKLKNYFFLPLIIFLLLIWQFYGNFFRNEILYSLLICIIAALYILVGSSKKYILINNIFFTYIGKISFSFYLWHLPIIFFIKFYFNLNIFLLILLTFTLCMILSFITFNFIENNSRNNIIVINFIKLSFFTLPTLLFIVLIFYIINPSRIQNTLFKFEENFSHLNIYENKFKKYYDPYTKYANGKYLDVKIIDCIDKIDKKYLIENCYKKRNNNKLFFLFGTSHAAHFVPTFNNSKIIDNLFFSAIGGGIGLDDTYIYTNDDFNNNIKLDALEVRKISNISKNIFKEISNQYNESYIIWSERLPHYIENYVITDNEHKRINQNSEIAIKYIEEKILKTFNSFNNTKIILIANIPEPKNEIRFCLKKILFEKKAKTICDYNRNDDLNRRDAVLKMYQKIAYENDNYFLYDPYNQICFGKKCKFFDENNLPIIYDGSHMTNEFAIKLSNHFDNWFKRNLF